MRNFLHNLYKFSFNSLGMSKKEVSRIRELMLRFFSESQDVEQFEEGDEEWSQLRRPQA